MPIQVLARPNNRAEILIHEPIGENWYGDGLTSKRFIKDLEDLGDVSDILVRINSPGGAVFDGIAIYNALKNHKAAKEVLIEGLAASAASFIAMCGDTIRMGEGAMMMVHNPWTFAMGDASDMREVADMLDKVGDSLIDIYHARTKIDRTELKALLDAETWLTAKEAIERGFADAEESAADEEAAASVRQSHQQKFKQFAAKAATVSPLRIAAAVFKSAPADASTLEASMPTAAPASVQSTDKTPEQIAAEARTQTLAAEKQRTDGIRSAFGRFVDEHRELLDTCLKDQECTVEAARAKLLAKLGEQHEPSAGNVQPGADARDKLMAGAESAILARIGIGKREAGNEYNGLSLPDIAAVALNRVGIVTRGLTRSQIASRVLASLTSSDFPQLMSNVAGKVLRNAYENFPNTWNLWAAAGSVSDFKIHPRIQTGSFNSLATIPEGGEYTYGSLAEQYENAQAETKGKAIALTRQMIVNDDLSAFNRRAQLMGRAAARSVNGDAYAYLTSGSSNHGPTSKDTGQFFNATVATTAGGHANLTSSGTAISTTSIAIGRQTMRKQKDGSNRETLNIMPKVLLAPVGKEDLAWAVINSATDVSQSNPAKKNYAAEVARVNLVTDPYLDDISATAWYLFADPADIAAFEVVFLDGVQTPFVDEMIDFETDAMKFKVRLDYGIAIGDWRAGYKNVGA